MYYSLLDLIRSPELIKMITGEFDTHVVETRQKMIKERVWAVKRKMFLEDRKRREKLKDQRIKLLKQRRMSLY